MRSKLKVEEVTHEEAIFGLRPGPSGPTVCAWVSIGIGAASVATDGAVSPAAGVTTLFTGGGALTDGC
jgi:hypothetical protein